MKSLHALTLSIGVLGAVAAWLFLQPLAGSDAQIWQAFIAWAAFFHCGGKIAGAKTATVGMVFGAIVGALAVWLSSQLGALDTLAAPVAIGIGAALLVAAAHLPQLGTIPASVYGFAAIAGLILSGGLGQWEALPPTIIAIVLGVAFGWLSEFVGGKLTKA